MIILGFFASIALLSALIVFALKCSKTEPNAGLRIGLRILLAIGCITAIWSTFFIRYQPTPEYKVTGFPVPLEVLHLEYRNWVVALRGRSSLVLNMIVVSAVLALPAMVLIIVRSRFRRRGRSQMVRWERNRG